MENMQDFRQNKRLNTYKSIRCFLAEEMRLFKLGKLSSEKLKTFCCCCKVLAELIEMDDKRKIAEIEKMLANSGLKLETSADEDEDENEDE